MRIRFELNTDLSLDITLNIPEMIIITASVLDKNGKYYPQICSGKYLCEL